MGKIKFTKTELKAQQDAQKQYRRFLPTLQLKKQQLQLEVRQSLEQLATNRSRQQKLETETRQLFVFFGSRPAAEEIGRHVRVRTVRTGTSNIAGITVPTFDGVDFELLPWNLLETEWYMDECIAALKQAVSLRLEYAVLERQYELLSAELRTTSQRVNLFEKVKIPECRENIRRIRIMLGDLETSAVARCKIAKRKAAEAS